MRPRFLVHLTLLAAFSALAIPAQLAAQNNQDHNNDKKQPRYKLVDIGTLGGANSGNNGESIIANHAGTVTGFAETSTPDPNPAFCFNPDCLVSHAFQWREGVLTDLGSLPGGGSSFTVSINSQEQVVGFSQNGLLDPLTGIPEFVATVWQDGGVIDLGTFGGAFGLATMNNNRQQVVGCTSSDIPDPFAPTGVFYGIGTGPQQLRAFRWQGKQLQDLGTLGGPDACGVWINDRGQIAGASFTNSIVNPATGLPTLDPFLWENERMLDLGTLGGTVGFAELMNNRGQVIGISSLAEEPGACITAAVFGTPGCHAFLWDRGILTDLGTLGGNFSIPNWINEAGEIVGVASNQNEQTVFGFVWKKGVMTNLGTLPGDCGSQAFGLNSGGQVVGQSISCDGSTNRAVLWEKEGPALDLNTLVNPGSGLLLTDPKIVNDAGEIVLEGLLSNGDAHSVVLIPCKEGEEGCEDAAEGTSSRAQRNAAPITKSPTTWTHLPPPAAAWRAQMARRYHIPSAAIGPTN